MNYPLWVLLLLIAGSMAAKDVFYNVATFLISRKHGFYAGIADGFGDIFSVLSVGVTAILTVTNGFSVNTIYAFAALLVGSIVGGTAGTKLGVWFSDTLDRRNDRQ